MTGGSGARCDGRVKTVNVYGAVITTIGGNFSASAATPKRRASRTEIISLPAALAAV